MQDLHNLGVNPCPSEYTLDRLHVKEVTLQEGKEIQVQTKDCDDCDSRLHSRKKMIAQLNTRPEFQALLEKEWARHKALSTHKEQAMGANLTSPSIWMQFVQWIQDSNLLAFGSIAALLLFLLPPQLMKPDEPKVHKKSATQTNSQKQKSNKRVTVIALQKKMTPKSKQMSIGAATFRILAFRKGTPYPKWIRDQQVLSPGALVQFSYTAKRAKQIMIVGMNQKGETYAFAPYLGQSSINIQAGQGRLPAHSALELDDYIGPERFFFFISNEPFSVKQAEQALKNAFQKHGNNLAQLKRIPGPWVVGTLLIHKRKL